MNNLAYSQPTALEKFLWKNRLLLYSLEGVPEPSYTRLKKSIEKKQIDIKERDLIVSIFSPSDGDTLAELDIDESGAAELMKWAELKSHEPLFLLIGKDGGIKMRGGIDTPLTEIFKKIDSMPMRKREMQKGNSYASPEKERKLWGYPYFWYSSLSF